MNFILLMLVRPASATVYSGRFCFKWDTDFADAEAGYDDYYTDNSVNEIARGVYYEVRRSSSGLLMDSGYALESGTYAGCIPTPIALSDLVDYDVTIFSKTQVNSNWVQVYDDSTSPALYADLLLNDWSPSATGPWNVATTVSGQWVNVISAASTVLFRHNGGLTAYVYKAYDDGFSSGCSTGGGATLTACDYVFIATWSQDQKYVIAHEIGHLMAKYANEGDGGANASYGAPMTTECESTDDHSMVSVEYQSAAASEGIAHFIAATTFNDTSGGYCWFDYYKAVDWDGDTFDDNGSLPDWADCDANRQCDNVGETCGPISATDHFGNECNSSVTANRGVEYDWLRMLWDLRVTSNVPFADILGIWNESDPHTWADDDTPSTAHPADRLSDAAASYMSGAYSAYWDYWSGLDGTDR